MTQAQKRLRELRERQSKERQRMAELALVDELNEEQRSELDTMERGTPDLERQIRAATVAVEDEEKEAETRALELSHGAQTLCRGGEGSRDRRRTASRFTENRDDKRLHGGRRNARPERLARAQDGDDGRSVHQGGGQPGT